MNAYSFKTFDQLSYSVNPDSQNQIESINYNPQLKNYNYISVQSNPTDTNYKISRQDEIDNKILELRTQKSPLLISLLKYEEVESGHRSEAIRFVSEELSKNKIAAVNWVNYLYIENLTDEKIITGILKMLEYFPEETFYPVSHTIALASLIHANDEIKELSARIFESWGSIRSYQILKDVDVEAGWLKAYINEIIKDLEESLCLS